MRSPQTRLQDGVCELRIRDTRLCGPPRSNIRRPCEGAMISMPRYAPSRLAGEPNGAHQFRPRTARGKPHFLLRAGHPAVDKPGSQIFATCPAGRHVQRLATHLGWPSDHLAISAGLIIMRCIGETSSAESTRLTSLQRV